jgi:hypothetical protein
MDFLDLYSLVMQCNIVASSVPMSTLNPTLSTTPEAVASGSLSAQAALAAPVPEAPATGGLVAPAAPAAGQPVLPREIGGRAGPEPTRFGDWERSGRCIDF